jgi:hypothetical protein
VIAGGPSISKLASHCLCLCAYQAGSQATVPPLPAWRPIWPSVLPRLLEACDVFDWEASTARSKSLSGHRTTDCGGADDATLNTECNRPTDHSISASAPLLTTQLTGFRPHECKLACDLSQLTNSSKLYWTLVARIMHTP